MCDSIYVKHSEQVHLQRQKVNRWVPGTGGEMGVCEENGGIWVSIGGDKNVLYLVMVANFVTI